MKKICIIGLGYIGLPTAAVLACHGQIVRGVDTDENLLQKMNGGEIHINEPELNVVVQKVLQEGNLQLNKSPEAADVFIIAVPTPINKDRTCDLSFVLQAVNSILPYLVRGNTLIIESTIPPQTCAEIIKPIIHKAGFVVGKDIFLAHCPERVLPGKIMQELIENNRIIGGSTPECARAAAEIYRIFVKGEIVETDAATAEMTKLMENTFRDVNIALVNEMVKICSHLHIDGLKVIELANKHPRVNLHQPGPGVGGHCLAVDPYFIIEKAPHLAKLIRAARNSNTGMPGYIVDKAKALMKGVKSARIAVFGISYKGNVGDLRESPALEIIDRLIRENFSTSIYDPFVVSNDRANDVYNAVADADMILILADHDEFRDLNYEDLARKMRTPIIFDTKNIVKPEDYDRSKVCLYNLGNT